MQVGKCPKQFWNLMPPDPARRGSRCSGSSNHKISALSKKATNKCPNCIPKLIKNRPNSSKKGSQKTAYKYNAIFNRTICQKGSQRDLKKKSKSIKNRLFDGSEASGLPFLVSWGRYPLKIDPKSSKNGAQNCEMHDKMRTVKLLLVPFTCWWKKDILRRKLKAVTP